MLTGLSFQAPRLAAQPASFLADGERTNGRLTLGALDSLQQKATASTVLIGAKKGNTLPAAAVSEDGYLLTAASEALHLTPLRAFLPDGTEVPARIVKHEEPLNLLLLKIEKTVLKPVVWGDSKALKLGQWFFSVTDDATEMRLGVMSAKRRPIPNSGAVLGVRFGVDDAEEGVIVEEVAADSPADRAGLAATDVLMAVNGEKVYRNENVARIISAHRPGDLVKLQYMREGKSRDCEVRLASKRHVLMNWMGEDFANHGVSLRTDNFPEVIQHDQPLDPEDIGGALFDLNGQAVALNIARVDRVTNYALPVETFLPKLTAWMQEDRKTPSAKETAAGEE